jgi:uncharacterized protein
MTGIILSGHKVTKGKAQGEALVSRQPISFMGGVDPESGLVLERGHPLEGMSVSKKILIFPAGKGSSLGSYRLYEMARCGTQPAGMINIKADPVIVAGAIISNIPMIDRLERDPFELIETGDYIELDADEGFVRLVAQPCGRAVDGPGGC